MNINGEYGVVVDNVSALDSTASIHLGNDQIDLTATTILVNGQLIGTQAGYVTNPMSTNLNCSHKDLTNVNLINGIDIETINDNLNATMTKTIFIDSGLYIDGTHFNNNIYADKFIINGNPSPAGFLMSDGTILNNSSSNNNSNIYLYNSSTTTIAPPSSSQIRFNNLVQQNATTIWISHMTRDGVDIDAFLALISQVSVVYLQDQDNSTNYIKYNVNTTPTITPNSYVTLSVSFLGGSGTGLTNFPNGMNIFLSIFSNDVEIDSRISTLETKTQNQSATSTYTNFNKTLQNILNSGSTFTVKNPALVNLFQVTETAVECGKTITMGTNKITGLGDPTLIQDATTKNYVDTQDNLKLNLGGGTMTGALLMNNNNISGVGNLSLFNPVNNGIAYFGGGFLANANKDFFIQSGGISIQAMINQISLSVGNVIRLSSSAWTESPICYGQNYTICGAPCAIFNQMTQITGNFSIGSASASSTQTRIRLKDLKIIGNLVFNNDSTFQELRTYIDNCDISGTITFPTSVVTASGLGIYFTNCSFSGSNNPLTTIPNQTLYSIYFTDCTFNSQPITNNLTAGNFSRLIYTNCSILPSLSLGNCVLNGLNASASVSSLTTGSITLGGASSSFLMGNGSLNSTTYAQVSSGTFTMTWSGGGTASGSQTIYYSKIGIPNGAGTVTLRFPSFVVTIGATSTTAITSTAPISVGGLTLNPTLGAPLIAVPIKFNNNQVGLGWIEINTVGNLGIYGPTFGTYWTANTTNCGLGNIATITYTV